jgi:hypothetical protein
MRLGLAARSRSVEEVWKVNVAGIPVEAGCALEVLDPELWFRT